MGTCSGWSESPVSQHNTCWRRSISSDYDGMVPKLHFIQLCPNLWLLRRSAVPSRKAFHGQFNNWVTFHFLPTSFIHTLRSATKCQYSLSKLNIHPSIVLNSTTFWSLFGVLSRLFDGSSEGMIYEYNDATVHIPSDGHRCRSLREIINQFA